MVGKLQSKLKPKRWAILCCQLKVNRTIESVKIVSVNFDCKCENGTNLLLSLSGGIPHKYYNGTMNHSKFGKLNLMVIQLLGKSLAQLQIENRGKFTPKTVYEIGIQLVRFLKLWSISHLMISNVSFHQMYRIEMIHRKGLVHRDIKPGNMGIGKSKQLIYIFGKSHQSSRWYSSHFNLEGLIFYDRNLDFGLAERIKDDENRHISEGPKGEYGSGTPRYMSAYAQSHIVQSRRDDLEAIGFMLMSFLRGNLPWDDDTYGKPAPINPMVRKKKNLHFKVSIP